MTEWTERPSVRRQIGTLVGILLASVVAAGILTIYFLYAYAGGVRYEAKDLLLDPQLAATLSFVDTQVGYGKEGRMVLDAIVVRYYDIQGQRWQEKAVSLASYAAVYERLSGDVSLDVPAEEVLRAFERSTPWTLVLKVRPAWQPQGGRILEELDTTAAAKDYYRITLQTPSPEGRYAYFRRAGIFDALQALTEAP